MKYFSFVFITLALLTIGCQRENQEIGGQGDGTPIGLKTRSVGTDILPEGEKMGMYVTSAGMALKTLENIYDNVEFTLGTDGWSSKMAVYYPNDKPVDIYTYLPYQETVADVNHQAFAVKADQSVEGAYKDSDLLWAKTPNQGKTDEGLTLNLRHLMSKVEVKLIAGDGITEDYLKGASVKILNLKTQAVADLATGVVQAAEGSVGGEIIPAVAGDLLTAAIVVPQSVAAGTETILITLDGERTYKPEHDITFTPGKVKRFEITVSNESLKVNVVTVEEWTPDGTITGDAEIRIEAGIDNGNEATGVRLDAGDQFGAFFISGGNTLGNNVLYEAASDGSVSSSTVIYYPAADEVNLYAYMPYRGELENIKACPVTVSADQSNAAAIKAVDFLRAEATGLKTGGSGAALNFKHQMSKVVVNLVKGNGITDANLAAANVTFCNIQAAAQIDLTNGVLSNLSGSGVNVSPLKNGNSYSAILIPQMITGKTFVKVSLSGTEWIYEPANLLLKQGSRYTLNITVTNSGITVNAPVVEGWNDEEIMDVPGTKVPQGAMLDGGICQATIWNKVVSLGGDMIYINDTGNKTYVYIKPLGYDGIVMEFGGNGLPGRILTTTGNGIHDMALFFAVGSTKLGMGLITEDRQIAIAEPIIMPQQFKNGKLSEKIQETIRLLNSLITTNGMEAQFQPISFGFGSALVNRLHYVDLANLPSFAENGNQVLAEVQMATECDIVDAGKATMDLIQNGALDRAEQEYEMEISVIKDGSQYGFGDIKVTLKWDVPGDVDLYLSDPKGHTISYSDETCTCGGSLDKDDTSGTGPENIFFPKNKASSGTYKIQVNNYGGRDVTYTLFIYVKGKTKTYSKPLSSSHKKDYFTFDLNGNFAEALN